MRVRPLRRFARDSDLVKLRAAHAQRGAEAGQRGRQPGRQRAHRDLGRRGHQGHGDIGRAGIARADAAVHQAARQRLQDGVGDIG